MKSGGRSMKDEIAAFKQSNGNNSYSQKDMISYLVVKVDKIHDDVSRQFPKCSSMFISKTTFWKIVSIGVISIGGLTGLVFAIK